jgi:hypothetical protein
MHPERYREFPDRLEYELDGEHFLEEFLSVECPLCGEITLRVVTNYRVTYYVHVRDGTNFEDYCQANRGSESIPEPILYTPFEGSSVISLVEAIW